MIKSASSPYTSTFSSGRCFFDRRWAKILCSPSPGSSLVEIVTMLPRSMALVFLSAKWRFSSAFSFLMNDVPGVIAAVFH